MTTDDDRFVPARLLDALRAVAASAAPVGGPLPHLAATWYTTGGCWNLALALHDATGLPIELYVREGQAKHAYVVSGETAIDARGRITLRQARAGAERSSEVDAEGLHAVLLEFGGAKLVAFVGDESVRRPAEAAASVILEAIGWGGGDS